MVRRLVMNSSPPQNANPDSTPLSVLCFSDVLCFWAYASQIRFDEAQATFGERIDFKSRCISIFGSVRRQFARVAESGGLSYNEKAQAAVAVYDHVEVHPELWLRNIPSSSTPCHLFLCAIEAADARAGNAPGASAEVARQLRIRFFRDLVDVSARSAQFALAEDLSIPRAGIEEALASGDAHALLAEHAIQASTFGVAMSPTLILDGGRQRLSGNVGYRVIEANITELLHRPPGEQSWC
ncbi:MAG: DsbA family protein [Deltaproteobacteria bacterium]|nr:DsbA family protein [Deltaproteobacteria bacterium]